MGNHKGYSLKGVPLMQRIMDLTVFLKLPQNVQHSNLELYNSPIMSHRVGLFKRQVLL